MRWFLNQCRRVPQAQYYGWVSDFCGRCPFHAVHELKIKILFRNAFYQSSFESNLKVSHDWLSPGTTSTPNTVVDATQYCRNFSTLFPLGTKKRHFHSPKCNWELNTQYQETVMIFFYNKIKMLKRIKVPLYFSAHSFTIVRGKRTLKGKHPANRQSPMLLSWF